jgi:hypothetical protein
MPECLFAGNMGGLIRAGCAASRCTSWAGSAAPALHCPAASPLHDALNALTAAAHAAITGYRVGQALVPVTRHVSIVVAFGRLPGIRPRAPGVEVSFVSRGLRDVDAGQSREVACVP